MTHVTYSGGPIIKYIAISKIVIQRKYLSKEREKVETQNRRFHLSTPFSFNQYCEKEGQR